MQNIKTGFTSKEKDIKKSKTSSTSCGGKVPHDMPYFEKYINEMKSTFSLKQRVVDQVMAKYRQFLEVRQKYVGRNKQFQSDENVLKGPKLTYAMTIFFLVIKDLNIAVKLKDIVDASVDNEEDFQLESIRIA